MEKDSEQQAAKYDTSYEYGVDIKESRKRPRTKKHRPKIYDDSKPDPNLNSPKAPRTPKTPKTPNPLTPNRVQRKCRSSSKTPTTGKRALKFDVGDLSRTINDNQESNGQKYLHVYRRRFKARPNAICLDTPAFQFYMRRVEVNGRKDVIVYQRRYKKQRVENALSATKKVVDKKKKVYANVDLDNNSLRVWKRLVANGGEPVDEEKDEWWKRQGVKFGRRMDSFLEKMHHVQGDMRFSPWKGSVTDSVVGAYLTQNVTDHLSSSAFMSVAAKFPPEIRNKELSFHDEFASSQESVASTSCPDASGTTEPVQVKFCGSSLYDSNGERILKKEKKKETKIDWDGLRKSYCGCEEEVNEKYKDAVDWNAVRLCEVTTLANTIIERGMHNKLAKRIKFDFLDRIYKDHGSLDLEWLRNVPPLKAKEFLLSFFGLGLKSVECIRLLSLHHLAFPVDTNVARVATRLGWVPLQSLPDDVPIHHLNAYPPSNNIQKYLFPRLCTLGKEKLYELHCHLITFGKVFCTKRKPNCSACPMKAECLHYASAFPSCRLAISESNRSGNVTSIMPLANEPIIELPLSPGPEAEDTFPVIEDIEDMCNPHTPPSPYYYQAVNMGSSSYRQTCEPIVEVPPSPEPEANTGVPSIADIEDLVYESDDDDDGGGDYDGGGDDGVDDDDGDRDNGMSQALALPSLEALDILGPKKFSPKWRTMHLVYELPNDHPCLAGFEAREPEDPTPYLLSLWFPGEDRKSPEYLHNRTWILNKSNGEEEVQATVLIPCRTATRGSFPLNGTYFQVNEVFADDETSHVPLKVPRNQLLNLQIRILGCGTSTTSIHRGLSTSAIQRLFCTGSICVRGFDRKARTPMPLHSSFHSTRRNSTSSTGLV